MPSPLTLVRLPIGLGLRAAGLAFGLVRRVAGAVIPEETASETPDTVPPARVTIKEAEAAPRSRRRAAPPARRRRPAPPAPEPPEPAHVSEEPVPVASFAEPGAEDGPGPEIALLEPWDGYDGMRAAEIERELRVADAEVAAAVKLYESSRRARITVLNAAERRLQT